MPVVGENVPSLTLTQSQQTPSNNITMPNGNVALSNIRPGFGTPSEDGTVNGVQVAVQAGVGFDNKIYPQPNILDEYSSYTYSLTLYLLTGDALAKVQAGDMSVLSTQAIIVQSGGINNAQRSPYFDVDFYFDKVDIDMTPAGGSGSSTTAAKMDMTIVEPNGITLIPRLRAAIKAMNGSGGGGKDQAIGAQNFLLAIRFYGYDADGNLVQVGNSFGGTPDYALVQKFYPIQINQIEFKVQNRLAEYHITATPVSIMVAKGQNQNSLMYNVEVSGATVKEVLTTGTSVTTGTTTGQTAETTGRISEGATPKNTVRLGLVSALNQYQRDLVAKGTYTIPHTYAIEFVDDEIANALVSVKDGRTKGTGMPLRGGAADQRDPRRQSMDKTVRLIDFTAGQQITQIIDQTIRNSTYITDQSNLQVAESTQLNSTNVGNQELYWYKISMQAIPKGYDPKRNDFAYTIRYVVSKFKTQTLISPYFKPVKYAGAVKEYNYWFTGLNTAILSYEQTMQNQQTIIVGGRESDLSPSLRGNEDYKQIFSPRSGESSQGAAGRTNDISANAADFLYDLASLSKAEVTIVGDPAWMGQGELVNLPSASGWSYAGFYPDGSISFDGGHVMFEIAFSAPADYDLSTGLMDPDTQINGIIDNVGNPNVPRQRIVYNVTRIQHTFDKGKFTQKLEGAIDEQLTKEHQIQLDQSIGKNTRPGVFDITPARRSLVTSSIATSQLLTSIGGSVVQNSTALDVKVQSGSIDPTNNNVSSATLDYTLPALPPVSNGLVTNLPSTDTEIVTNSASQLINREA